MVKVTFYFEDHGAELDERVGRLIDASDIIYAETGSKESRDEYRHVLQTVSDGDVAPEMIGHMISTPYMSNYEFMDLLYGKGKRIEVEDSPIAEKDVQEVAWLHGAAMRSYLSGDEEMAFENGRKFLELASRKIVREREDRMVEQFLGITLENPDSRILARLGRGHSKVMERLAAEGIECEAVYGTLHGDWSRMDELMARCAYDYVPSREEILGMLEEYTGRAKALPEET